MRAMQFSYLKRGAVSVIGCCWILAVHTPLLPAANAQSPPKPSLSIPSTGYDFGEVMEGAVVEHHFLVRNTGNATLEIRKVSRD
jgi:hypothetical protein